MKFVDLSHTFEDGMPGFKMKTGSESIINYTAQIKPFLKHEDSKAIYQGKASFEITQMSFQTSLGTYLDSPFHRFPDKRDISKITLDEVILPGIVIALHHYNPHEMIGLNIITKTIATKNLTGMAVLFNFNWSYYWGTDQYYDYPFISEEIIDFLISKKVKLVGVDTLNIDDSHNLYRPAHTKLLQEDILIVENLTNLENLLSKEFRFFAVPLKAKNTAAMPIRAFAELNL